MKVVLLLDHAPDYRESFLRELSLNCTLTVIAHPCERDNLSNPAERVGYQYYEITKTWGEKIRWNNQHQNIIKNINPDLICVALNLRYPLRFITFLFSRTLQSKWIWWGQIFGRNDNSMLVKLKKHFISNSKATLVYSDDIKVKLGLPGVTSFDNSQFSKKDYVPLENKHSQKLKCLFVGRPQARKKLDLLFLLANRKKNISIKIVGPGVPSFFAHQKLPENIELFPEAHGEQLLNHFEWSNIVVNPGHAGLLVMNAACHKRPIIINSNVQHAPEIILAREAGQYFVNFDDTSQVDELFDRLAQNPSEIEAMGEKIFEVAREKYTIEQMALKHMKVFKKVFSENISSQP